MSQRTLLGWIACLSLMAGITVEAREFYRINFKAKLFYTDLSGTKKMGQTSGYLTGGDDGAFTRLSFEGKTYDITLEITSQENPWMNRNGRPDLIFTLPYEPMKALLHESNGSIWRSAALENHVSELIDRYLSEELESARQKSVNCRNTHPECRASSAPCRLCPPLTEGRTVSASYFERGDSKDLDQTITRLQFHDDRTPESLHLVINFDNRSERL